MKPLLVGEHNPHSDDAHYALYPYPSGCAGARLRDILDLPVGAYLAGFDRCNLLSGPAAGARWSAPAARARAAELRRHPRVLVLCGRRVTEAFGQSFVPFMISSSSRYPSTMVILPHPSGRSRGWLAPGAAEQAREALRAVRALPGLSGYRDLGGSAVEPARSVTLRCTPCMAEWRGCAVAPDCPECGENRLEEGLAPIPFGEPGETC